MFPKNLLRDFFIAVAVASLLVGMAAGKAIPAAWSYIKPMIHEATAQEWKP